MQFVPSQKESLRCSVVKYVSLEPGTHFLSSYLERRLRSFNLTRENSNYYLIDVLVYSCSCLFTKLCNSVVLSVLSWVFCLYLRIWLTRRWYQMIFQATTTLLRIVLSEVATQQGIKVPKCPVLSVFLITFCTDHENISTVEMKTTKPFSPIESINDIRKHHLSNPI